jgi:hypothetical protein
MARKRSSDDDSIDILNVGVIVDVIRDVPCL